MRQRVIPALLATVSLLAAPASHAVLLELALVIDGSGSIDGPNGNNPGPDWGLQMGSYQNIFEDNFYTNFVEPSNFTSVAVAAYIFSGGASFTINSGGSAQVFEYAVYSYIDWTEITNDATAAAFGAQFAGIPQPGGSTDTQAALLTALNGGAVGCPIAEACVPTAPLMPPFQNTVAGLLNNSYDGDALVIDISTDGVPTEPNGDGTPNTADEALALAAADEARANGVTVNAIGVGDQIGADFLSALVGLDPAVDEFQGFFVTADGFDEFEATLREKVRLEIIPVPAALPLFLSALGGLAFWRRRTT